MDKNIKYINNPNSLLSLTPLVTEDIFPELLFFEIQKVTN